MIDSNCTVFASYSAAVFGLALPASCAAWLLFRPCGGFGRLLLAASGLPWLAGLFAAGGAPRLRAELGARVDQHDRLVERDGLRRPVAGERGVDAVWLT